MDIILTPVGWKGLAGFSGLFLFWLIENIFPFRRRLDPALRHYAVNLILAAGNAAAVGFLFRGAVVAYAGFLSGRGVGLLNLFPVEVAWNLFISILYFDFVTYLWHIAYHRMPFLWRLHRVHHTDRDLDVTSASRFHLGEIALSALFRLGVMTLLGPAVISIIVFEGALLAAAQFQHSNFRLPEPFESWVRAVFVTPDMHRVHHSDIPRETNSNFSTIFSFWDRLFGTFRTAPQEKIVIGLKEYTDPKDRTLLKLIILPFAPPCGKDATESGSTISIGAGR